MTETREREYTIISALRDGYYGIIQGRYSGRSRKSEIGIINACKGKKVIKRQRKDPKF